MGDSDEVHGALHRAELLREAGRPAQALTLLAPLARAQPGNAEVWLALARAALDAGTPAHCLDYARRAQSLAPHDPEPHLLLAQALLTGDGSVRPAARRHARTAVGLAPDFWWAHALHALTLTGPARRRAPALQAARRAVALAPHEPQAHAILAQVHSSHGSGRAARARARQALALGPQDAAALAGYASAQATGLDTAFRPDRLADASKVLAHALRADPGDVTVQRVLDQSLHRALHAVAYLVFLDAIVLGRITTGPLQHAVALGATLPPAFAAVYLARVTPTVRAHLRRRVREPRLAGALALLVSALAVEVALPLLGTDPDSVARTLGRVAAALAAALALSLITRQDDAVAAGPGRRRAPSGLFTLALWATGASAALVFYALGLTPSTGRPGIRIAVGACAVVAVGWACRRLLLNARWRIRSRRSRHRSGDAARRPPRPRRPRPSRASYGSPGTRPR